MTSKMAKLNFIQKYRVKSTKAQSAIEYLMTYGWMLFVVAIVGGAVFALSGDQSIKSISGFTGADVQLDDFGITTDDNLELVLLSAASSNIDVNKVNVTDGGSFTSWSGDLSLGARDTDSLTLANVSEGGGSNSLDVEISYDKGQLTNLEVTGSISGNFELANEASEIVAKPPAALSTEDFQVTQQ